MASVIEPSERLVGTARLIIVDDHPVVRQGLAELLSAREGLDVVGQAADADQALELVRHHAYDLALVDLSLGGLSGLELIKNLKTECPTLPVLVLSMHDEMFYAERALRAGARGYITKEQAVEEIHSAIDVVLSGEIYVSEEVSAKMLHRFVEGSGGFESSDVELLSDRELEVFQLLGQGYGTRQVAEMLHISPKTVESYRANIKEKLHLRNAAELVQTAVQWVQASRSL